MQEDFGIMTEAYHISRTDLMVWVNKLLSSKLYRIEQLGTGAIHCQLIDYFFPGSLNISKVSWKSQNSWEFVANFKVLQQGFDNLGLKKKIDVERLTLAKYQDNLEFAQWIKRFCDLNGTIPMEEYDGVAKRSGESIFYLKNINKYKTMMAMVTRRDLKAESNKMGRKSSGAKDKHIPGYFRTKSGQTGSGENVTSFKKAKTGPSSLKPKVLKNKSGLKEPPVKRSSYLIKKKNESSKKIVMKDLKKSSNSSANYSKNRLQTDLDYIMCTLKTGTDDKEIVAQLRQKFKIIAPIVIEEEIKEEVVEVTEVEEEKEDSLPSEEEVEELTEEDEEELTEEDEDLKDDTPKKPDFIEQEL